MPDPKKPKNVTLPIAIFSEFNPDLALNVLGNLLFYEDAYGEDGFFQDKDNPANPTIKMYINSPGGICTDLMSILDSINSMSIPIETYCIGMAASCASILLSNGAKGKRFIGKNSHVLLHQVSTGSCGQIEDVERDIKFAKKLNEQILSILAKNTGKKKEDIRKDMDRDLWLNAKEAVAYGLVDKILDENSNELKSFNKINEMEFKNNNINLERKVFDSKLEIKSFSEDDDYFYFEGYVSDFNSKDFKDDIIHKGAFKRTLATSEILKSPNERTIVWNHDLDNPVGIAYLKEDSIGLFFKGTLPKADDFVRGKVIPQIKLGSVQNMSFGYIANRVFYKDGCRNITDIELFEVTIATIGMNTKSKITSFKSLNKINMEDIKNIKDLSNYLKSFNISKKDTEDVFHKMKEFIKQGNPDNQGKLDCSKEILDILTENIKKTNELTEKFKGV